MKAKWEEEKYRRALKWKWGFALGDPRLKSIKKDGKVVEGYFGGEVKGKAVEEDSHD
jgi:hypothetical protein